MATATRAYPHSVVDPPGTKHQITRSQLAEFLTQRSEKSLADVLQAMFGASGVIDTFGPGATQLELQAGIANDAFRVRAGVGFIQDAAYANYPGLVDWDDEADIAVANNLLGATYHVGFRVARVPIPTTEGLVANARTGAIEYVGYRLEVGECAQAATKSYNAVTDQITLTVGNVVGAGAAENLGVRLVRLWLVDPVTAVAAQAFLATATVWAGGQYSVVLPAGQRFGMTPAQAAATGSYGVMVLMPYPRCTRLVDLRLDAEYLYVGNFQGTGPGNPIGAIDLSDVTHYTSTLAALAAHLDGGASKHDADEIDDETAGGHHGATVQATLDTLDTDLGTAEGNITALVGVVGELWEFNNNGALSGLGLLRTSNAYGCPLRRIDNVAPALDQIDVGTLWFLRDATDLPVSKSGVITPPDNKTTLVTYDPLADTWHFREFGAGDHPTGNEVIVGMVTMVATEITLLEWWPQYAVPACDIDGFDVVGDASGLVVVGPGRIALDMGAVQRTHREFVQPYAVAIDTSVGANWEGGAVIDNTDIRIYVYAEANTTLYGNRVRLFLSNTAPDEAGFHPFVTTGSDPHGRRYVGSVYRTSGAGVHTWPGNRAGDDAWYHGGWTFATNLANVAWAASSLGSSVPPGVRSVKLRADLTFADGDFGGAQDRTTWYVAPEGGAAGDTHHYTIDMTVLKAEAGGTTARRPHYFEMPIYSASGGVPELYTKRTAGIGKLNLTAVGYVEDRRQPVIRGTVVLPI